MTTEQTELEQTTELKQTTETETETPKGIFQAIGVIVGDVAFIKDEGRDKYIANITIAGNQYNLHPLGFSWGKQASFMGLRKHIESTGVSKQRLVVYPKIMHFPDKEQQHKVSFQLVAFEKESKENSASTELNDFEFKLSGLWQFIPVCRIPCIEWH